MKTLKAVLMAPLMVWEAGRGMVYRMLTGNWPESWGAEAEAEDEVEQQSQSAAAQHRWQAKAVEAASRFVSACEKVALGEKVDLRTVPPELHPLVGCLTRGEASLVVHHKPADVMAFLEGRRFLPGVQCRMDGVRLEGPIATTKPAKVAPRPMPQPVQESLKTAWRPEDDYDADGVPLLTPRMSFGR